MPLAAKLSADHAVGMHNKLLANKQDLANIRIDIVRFVVTLIESEFRCILFWIQGGLKI